MRVEKCFQGNPPPQQLAAAYQASSQKILLAIQQPGKLPVRGLHFGVPVYSSDSGSVEENRVEPWAYTRLQRLCRVSDRAVALQITLTSSYDCALVLKSVFFKVS